MRVSDENKRGLVRSREILVSYTVRLLLLGFPPGDLGPSVPYVTHAPSCICHLSPPSLSGKTGNIILLEGTFLMLTEFLMFEISHMQPW